MKKLITLSATFIGLSVCLTSIVNAQVNIDKPINLNGGAGERKITNLETPIGGTDAVNKDYVDAAVVSAGGGGCQPTMVTNELTGSISSPTPCSGSACGTTYLWRDCSIACDNLNFDNHTDWRMPTASELAILINVAPANTSTNYIWTCSPNENGGNNTWLIIPIHNGAFYIQRYNEPTYCRCVR